MRKPQGYATIIDPESGTQELDSFTCGHCQHITHVKAGERPEDMGGLCKCCMTLICKHCVGKPCSPFLEQVERMEAKQDALRSYGF
jgi:hypothetical protein